MSNELIDRAWTIPIRRVKRFSATTFCLIICTLSAKKRLRIWTVLPTMSLTTVPKTVNTRVLNLSSCSFATFRYTRVCLTGRLSSARAGFLFMWVRPTLPRGFQICEAKRRRAPSGGVRISVIKQKSRRVWW